MQRTASVVGRDPMIGPCQGTFASDAVPRLTCIPCGRQGGCFSLRPAIGTSFADAKVGAWSISSRRLRTLVCVESSHVAFVRL